MKKIAIVIGARPQFIKHAAVELALREHFEIITLHTGQHYDKNMSDIFFEQLRISPPRYFLKIGSGSHGEQTGLMMVEIEKILISESPDLVIVYGDTNSTLAGALVAAKMNIKICHIESGLRSFNKSMPEEINRILTDHISEILLCPTNVAVENLLNEGINPKNIFEVGDVMADMVQISLDNNFVKKTLEFDCFYFATIHRPYNTDNDNRLQAIVDALANLDKKVYFSVHPRTLARLNNLKIDFEAISNIAFLPPVSYFESLEYQFNSSAVITDSGGIQKEAYLLGKKCITIRSETEWIETVNSGWNFLVFEDFNQLPYYLRIENPATRPSFYGDGNSSKKILDIICQII